LKTALENEMMALLPEANPEQAVAHTVTQELSGMGGVEGFLPG